MFLNLFFYKHFAFLLHHGSCFLYLALRNNVKYKFLFKELLKKLLSIVDKLLHFLSSTCFDVGIGHGCSSTTGCCNSPSSLGFDVETNCKCFSTIGGPISASSSEFEILITKLFVLL